MRRIVTILLLLVTIIACQKEVNMDQVGTHRYPLLKHSLKDSFPGPYFNELDFSRVSQSVINKKTYLRIGFKNKSFAVSFVLVDVSSEGRINCGRIVTVERSAGPEETFNGTVEIKSLKGELIRRSHVSDGYPVTNEMATRVDDVLPDPYLPLPGVVVVGSFPSGSTGVGGISWGLWYNLVSFLDNGMGGGAGNSGGYYSGSNPFATGGVGAGAGGGTNNPSIAGYQDPSSPLNVFNDETIFVEMESQHADPAIDLDSYLKCFENIPDAGAVCRVTIYADVPVNSDPTRIMDWQTGSPGHTWIRLEKQGANSSGASQHIGFYPESGWKINLTDAPVNGKWVNNAGHEFNASYEITVSPERLRAAIMHVKQLRNTKYDIDDYNCTDWAMAIWQVAAHPNLWFDIPRFQMPGSLSPNGTSTPQGLYVKLQELKNAGVQGTMVPLLGWAGQSSGPCN